MRIATRKGVFEAVKTCLSIGCIYSPIAVSLLLKGPDNFVCNLYFLIIRELGSGWVIGKERLITSVSHSFAWSGARDASVRLYRYDAEGNLMDRDSVLKVASEQKLDLNVPEKGLIIAEIMQEG